MGLLVAGARSTGTTGQSDYGSIRLEKSFLTVPAWTASWMVTFIAGHPEWKQRIAEEVRTLLSHHSTEDCDRTIADKMAAIPLEAWENKTPVMDQIIREVLRLAQPHTAMRRNMGPETYLDGTRIPSGAYVVYPFGDIHLNPDLYPDPWAFKPDRPERKLPLEYVGWGGGMYHVNIAGENLEANRFFTGKTICMGQRLAKLQLKILTALMLSTMDFELVDKAGRMPHPLPQPNWNDALTCKPPSGSCYLQFVRVTP